MKHHLRIGAAALAVLSLSCSSVTDVQMADLAGTWTAQSAVFTNVANTAETFDMIANGGSFAMTLQADGNYTSSFTFGTDSETTLGTYAVEGVTLTLSESGQGSPEDFQVTHSGNNLTLTGPNSWDFDGDGNDDDATLVMLLTR